MVLSRRGRARDLREQRLRPRRCPAGPTPIWPRRRPAGPPTAGRIIFAMEPGPQLYVMPASGGTPQRVTFNTSSYCAEPDWSRARPEQGRLHDEGERQLPDRRPRPVHSTRASRCRRRRLTASSPRGCRTAATSSTRRARLRRAGVCILDTETGKSTPVSPSSFGPALQASVWSR